MAILPCTAAVADAAGAFCTSIATMRPWGPVPLRELISSPASRARRLARGEAKTLSPDARGVVAIAGAGAAIATGAAVGAAAAAGVGAGAAATALEAGASKLAKAATSPIEWIIY